MTTPSTRPTTVTLLPDRTPGAHPINSPDLRWWLPVIGPTGISLLLLCSDLDTNGRTYAVEELGALVGRQAPSRVWRALERLERFGAATFTGAQTVLVRTELPTLSEGLVTSLPAQFAAAYTTATQGAAR